MRPGSADAELMLTKEVGVMMGMLEEAGLRVVVATPFGTPIKSASAVLESDLLLEDVEVSRYAGFLLPCMAAGAPGVIEKRAVEMVKEAVAQGKPVAAQYGSVFTLARAGLLEGRAYAYEYSTFPEGTCGGTGVVQDGLVITSGTCPHKAREKGRPDGTPELTRLFIEAVLRYSGQ
ncbi:MAG: DJ-1/PfpI family protein [Spirochaetales bacterium]|nr:DJ-1/PfpI family protein [Spirochaetales bacterium]